MSVERMLEVKVPSAADIGRDPSGSARAIKHEKVLEVYPLSCGQTNPKSINDLATSAVIYYGVTNAR